MILLEEGFKPVKHQWKDCINMPQSKVEEILGGKFPNVGFQVFTEEKFKICSEEMYYMRIALVVNSAGIVCQPPEYFGAEPDLEKIADPVGKDYNAVCAEIKKIIPSVKVVVQDKDGHQKWCSKDVNDHYVLVKADQNNKVCEDLSYCRVAK